MGDKFWVWCLSGCTPQQWQQLSHTADGNQGSIDANCPANVHECATDTNKPANLDSDLRDRDRSAPCNRNRLFADLGCHGNAGSQFAGPHVNFHSHIYGESDSLIHRDSHAWSRER